jgi:hypothetical protein
MHFDRQLTDARVFVETSASANLDDVFRWLIDRHMNPLHLATEDLPALGQGARLKLARPISGRRAVLCGLWLIEDVDSGGVLLAGQIRFVAHPTASEIAVSFRGRTAMAMTSATVYRRAHHAVGQLLQVIAESIQGPITLTLEKRAAV